MKKFLDFAEILLGWFALFVVLLFFLGGIAFFLTVHFTYDSCAENDDCEVGHQFISDVFCGELITVSKENCPLIGGKWLPEKELCHIGFEHEDKDTCTSFGGIWNDKEILFKCDFTEHCKAKIKGKN